MKNLSAMVLACWCAGCSSSFNYAGLGNLRRLAGNQNEKLSYVRRQQALFERLRGDIEGKRLREGVLRNAVLARYGAASREEIAGPSPNQSRCLVYHHPTDYFSSPRYYLCFDDQGVLTRISVEERTP